MAVSFMKKGTSPKPANPPTNTGKSFGGSFLKKGAAAKSALAKEEAKAQKAKEEAGKLWRYYMKEGDKRIITFLDGALDADGMLDIPMFYQHTLFVNGRWEDFVCLEDSDEPCPICEAGERATLVGVMTVIDHTPHVIKNGPNAGKEIKDTRKLFVAKQTTLRRLQSKAEKHGGLTGCTFEVSRTSDKAPNVGDDFDFMEKNTLAELQDHFGKDANDKPIAEPADYEDEIIYRTAAELVALGVGKAIHKVGSEKGVNPDELADQL